MRGDLLEALASETGIFISNLRNRILLPKIVAQLRGVNHEDYTLEQWSYCLRYLFGGTTFFKGYDELNYFLDGLFLQIENETDAQ